MFRRPRTAVRFVLITSRPYLFSTVDLDAYDDIAGSVLPRVSIHPDEVETLRDRVEAWRRKAKPGTTLSPYPDDPGVLLVCVHVGYPAAVADSASASTG